MPKPINAPSGSEWVNNCTTKVAIPARLIINIENYFKMLKNSIYIDWGALITAIIDFFIIAFVIFTVVRLINKSREFMMKTAADLDKAYPDRKERKILKERGINLKDRKAVKEGLLQLLKEEEQAKAQAEANKPKPEKTEDILKDIRALLQAQSKTEENK